MHRLAAAALLFVTAACHGAKPGGPASPEAHSLAGIAAQSVAVLPTYAVRVMPGLAWSVGPAADIERNLDAEILSAFVDRGLRKQWVFPDQLQASYRLNVTYAADPYALAEEPLRAPYLPDDTRLPEPLATQVRTLVALHQDVRYVLAPVELRFETAGPTAGRGVLRVVLLDARMSNVRWSGEFASDTATAFGPAIAASIAARLAAAVAPQ